VADPLSSALEELRLEDMKEELLRRLPVGASLIASLSALVADHIRTVPAIDDDDEFVNDVVLEWVHEVALEEFSSTFHAEPIVRFGNPGGLYELWGLERVTISDRGLIVDFGDLDAVSDHRVWGAWDLTDKDAFLRAFERAYSDAWDEIGLPPFLGDCWDGDRTTLASALTSLLLGSKEARAMFVGRMTSLERDLPGAAIERELLTVAGARRLVDRFLDGTPSCP
jgi:hypothetical protein